MIKFLRLFVFLFGFYSYAQIGIGVDLPTATLDINGNVRVRDLPEQKLTNLVGVDVDGKFYKVDIESIIHEYMREIKVPVIGAVFQLNKNVSYSNINKPQVIPLNVEISLNSTILNYDIASGTFTVKEDGLYTMTLQVGITRPEIIEAVLGVIDAKTGLWIGRGSWRQENKARTYSIYTTTLELKKDDQFQFGISPLGGTESKLTVIGIESGTTGTGSLTNVTITKF